MIAFFKINHMVDLITNSSSELFVMEAKCSKEVIVELINQAFAGSVTVSLNDIESRFFKDGHDYDSEYKITEALSCFPESDRETLKEKYFKNPNYWGVVFDRDWVYTMDNDNGVDIRGTLADIGFELIDTDY